MQKLCSEVELGVLTSNRDSFASTLDLSVDNDFAVEVSRWGEAWNWPGEVSCEAIILLKFCELGEILFVQLSSFPNGNDGG